MPTRRDPLDQVLTEYLVLQIQDGDVGAGELLVRRWNERLLRHASRMTGRSDAAEEVLQESWLAIVRGLSRLNDPAAFPPWAYRIVTNQAALWVRKISRRRSVVSTVDSLPDPQAPDLHADDSDAVHEAIARLPPTDAAILDLRYLQGLGIDEIAQAMNVPAGTIKSRLHAARQRLRDQLTEEDFY